jgi:hypothetical protein
MRQLRNRAPHSVQKSDKAMLQIFQWKYIPAEKSRRLRKSLHKVMPCKPKIVRRPVLIDSCL